MINAIKKHLWLIVLFLSSHSVFSQMQYFPKDHYSLQFYDRYQHLYGPDSIVHSSIRNITRNDAQRYIANSNLTEIDQSNRLHIIKTLGYSSDSLVQEQTGLWNSFYKNSAHFFEVETNDFRLTVNPILNLQFGRESELSENIYLNKRGLEIWGELDQKFYFYSSYHENQASYYNFINAFINKYKSIPGQGSYKNFNSTFFNSSNGFDFSNAQAYFGFNLSKNSNLELGHGNHFFGNGIRSLLLSNYANNFFYLKLNLRVWRIHYQSIFAELNNGSPQFMSDNFLLPKKYMATHYFSFKASPVFEIGLFETVVFSREDHFEFQYLNPVILYRTVEHFLDSPDNVLLGLNVNWHLFPKTSVYGQVLLDEFKTSELFNGKGWWGNKLGYQVGVKHFDLFNVRNLDVQFEFNAVRPYTYSHHVTSEDFPEFSVSSYSHNNQALAHPLGANFSEAIALLRYQPVQRVFVNFRFLHSNVGRDNNGNYGSDILLDNSLRVSDFNNTLHQGASSKITTLDLNVSYELFHSFYLDIFIKKRKDTNQILGNTHTTFLGTGMRYNIANTYLD